MSDTVLKKVMFLLCFVSMQQLISLIDFVFLSESHVSDGKDLNRNRHCAKTNNHNEDPFLPCCLLIVVWIAHDNTDTTSIQVVGIQGSREAFLEALAFMEHTRFTSIGILTLLSSSTD